MMAIVLGLAESLYRLRYFCYIQQISPRRPPTTPTGELSVWAENTFHSGVNNSVVGGRKVCEALSHRHRSVTANPNKWTAKYTSDSPLYRTSPERHLSRRKQTVENESKVIWAQVLLLSTHSGPDGPPAGTGGMFIADICSFALPRSSERSFTQKMILNIRPLQFHPPRGNTTERCT